MNYQPFNRIFLVEVHEGIRMADDPVRSRVGVDGELFESITRAVDPLSATEPDVPLDDLDVVGETIGDADVIGMGEASHGTREFFRFKHRLFRYLVEEHGFRMLGLEANFAAMLDINDYVVRGREAPPPRCPTSGSTVPTGPNPSSSSSNGFVVSTRTAPRPTGYDFTASTSSFPRSLLQNSKPTSKPSIRAS